MTTLTGPQKIPFANSTSYWYEDNYEGSAMESNVGVLHTTEGTTVPTYGGGASSPNVTGLPDFAAKKIRWYQHHSVDRSSRALVNAAGGVQTNTLNCFQVELVGTCDPAHRVSWGSKRAGVDYVYWPDAADWLLAEVAVLVAWLRDHHDIPARTSVTFKAYPASYGGGNGVRLTGAQWSAYYGWLGHQHVPENDHGDPGDIDIAKIMTYANGGTVPPEEEEVAAEDVWKADVIAAAPPPYNNTDYDSNKKWSAGYALATTALTGRKNAEALSTLTSKVDELTAKVDRISTGGVDLDALAVKVADELYRRMAG